MPRPFYRRQENHLVLPSMVNPDLDLNQSTTKRLVHCCFDFSPRLVVITTKRALQSEARSLKMKFKYIHEWNMMEGMEAQFAFQVKEVAPEARRRDVMLSFAVVYPTKTGHLTVKELASSLGPHLYLNIFKCKQISETGAQQMLLDTQDVKTILLDILSLGKQMREAMKNVAKYFPTTNVGILCCSSRKRRWT